MDLKIITSSEMNLLPLSAILMQHVNNVENYWEMPGDMHVDVYRLLYDMQEDGLRLHPFQCLP